MRENRTYGSVRGELAHGKPKEKRFRRVSAATSSLVTWWWVRLLYSTPVFLYFEDQFIPDRGQLSFASATGPTLPRTAARVRGVQGILIRLPKRRKESVNFFTRESGRGAHETRISQSTTLQHTGSVPSSMGWDHVSKRSQREMI
jgi:hypothetical protein